MDKSKARMHLGPAQIPEARDKFGWLSVMQHYGAPARLLDFTYSPYLALYFALRNRVQGESKYAEVWGIDEATLRDQAEKTSREAEKKVRDRKGESIRHKISFRSEDLESPLQHVQGEDEFWEALIRNALAPDGIRREHFKSIGFIAAASPTTHNPRLSSQQGLFLFNGAEGSFFEDSLDRMMHDVERQWYKRFRIPEKALDEIEKQLFQLNIHDLSLFPDVEGLAGFVRQKARLHW